jgi:hypothetical protein
MLQGECIAYFPTISGTSEYDCLSYMHVGQHGSASLPPMGKAAKPSEYAELRAELESLGYILEIRRRASQNDNIKRRAELKTLPSKTCSPI